MELDINKDVQGQSEDALQQKCYFWFWNAYPNKRGLLFAVPNGGHRSKMEAKRLKMTGVYSGVSDLIFLNNGESHMIELKKDEYATQSKNQIDWEKLVTNEGFKYYVVRSLTEFKKLINQITEG